MLNNYKQNGVMIEDIVRYLILYFTVRHPFNFVFEKDNTFFELNVFLGGVWPTQSLSKIYFSKLLM